MPLYTFVCSNDTCKKEFDATVSLSEFDTKVVYCPDCDTKANRVVVAQRVVHSSTKRWRS